ncbi:MAG: hypothetical protein ABMA14_06410 [Hyphomonadaceae bacterium]
MIKIATLGATLAVGFMLVAASAPAKPAVGSPALAGAPVYTASYPTASFTSSTHATLMRTSFVEPQNGVKGGCIYSLAGVVDLFCEWTEQEFCQRHMGGAVGARWFEGETCEDLRRRGEY